MMTEVETAFMYCRPRSTYSLKKLEKGGESPLLRPQGPAHTWTLVLGRLTAHRVDAVSSSAFCGPYLQPLELGTTIMPTLTGLDSTSKAQFLPGTVFSVVGSHLTAWNLACSVSQSHQSS